MKNFRINAVNMRINFIAIFLSVLLALLNIPATTGDDWSASCASNCTCKWTNGKKSAICSSLQLTTIPTTLSTEIQVLVLNENHIPYLNREEFTALGLLNLQRIYLKKSEVQYIHKETFKNLKILVEIDLSDNKIEMIDKDTFMGNDRLRILLLNGNPLKKLVAYQFPILPHLRTLDLQNCLIGYIDPMAFANLNMLEYLSLKNNLLESMSQYVFQHMGNLKTLVLDENPWQCNCKLRKFRNWYISSKVNSISLTCKGPYAHKDKQWEAIDEASFGCQPKVEVFNNDDVQNIDIGANTTFSCLVYGDPMPEVAWELNGKNFDNDNVLFDQENVASDKLWSNLTVFNMSSLDAGTYTCSAQNVVGAASQNISIYLTEIVQHVLVKTPETFWYFGLIMGTFGTVFLLILLSFVVCLCKRTTRRRRHPNKNIKGSVSFNDQEKKLLDLSITTTTNDRGDSCIGIDNTPSMNKTESVIGFEPIEITVENRGGHPGAGGVGGISSLQTQMGASAMQMVSTHTPSGGGGGVVSMTGASGAAIGEEFPLNVGVFPPPPEFCSNVIPNPAYGNIFISVSVTQDMLDSSDINIYPDLLNIPQRVCDNGTILPVNVSPFATLPRNPHRRGILKKDTQQATTNLYPHDEIVSYHNLDTSYSQGYQEHQQQQSVRCMQQGHAPPPPTTNKTSCINCMKSQPHAAYPLQDAPSAVDSVSSAASSSSSAAGGGGQLRTLCSSIQHPIPSCLKYDNMGRRITASGNSTLSLPDEEKLENETLFNENNPLRTFSQHTQAPSGGCGGPTTATSSATTTQATQSDCPAGSDFVSL